MKSLRLTIDLIPSSCFFSNVRSEVKKSQWDKIRKAVYEIAGHKCEVCGGKGSRHPVECHEVFEYNDKTCMQTLKRMVALCPKCHHCKHWGLWELRGEEFLLYKHALKVNDCTKSEFQEHMIEAQKEWEERSQKDWNLDLTLLKTEYGVDIYEK